MHLPIVLCYATESALFINKFPKCCVNSFNSACVQSLVHVSIQVIELQKHACPILMYGPKMFLRVSKKGDVYTNSIMPICCAS